jgi:ADP-ribose pyrophosphatase YjhB (NUDIX family)
MGMPRHARYQAAILQDGKILLIQHREHASGRAYWLLPGGGMEDGETEEETVMREVREETHLEVHVEGLILDEPARPERSAYQRYKTYLCSPVTMDAAPGAEPEPEVAAVYAISQVGWFPLADESAWNEAILNDVITAPLLRRVRDALRSRAGSRGE